MAGSPLKAEKNFWTVKEAARYLGIAPLTFYSWLSPKNYKNNVNLKSKKKPPAFQFGAKWLIPIDEFKQWTENFRKN